VSGSPRRAHASRAQIGRNDWAAPEPVTGWNIAAGELGERAEAVRWARSPSTRNKIMKNEQLPVIDIKIKQPPVLFSKTQALIAQLAARLGGPLVAYWNGARG